MQMIESFTCSKKGSPDANEDILRIGNWYCLVADGVTTKNSITHCSKTGGQIAVECIAAALEQMNGDEDVHTALRLMRMEILRYLRDNNLPDWLQPQASMLVYNHRRKELWSVGDCPFLLNGIYYKNEKKLDVLLSTARKMAIEALLMEGVSEESLAERDQSREMILPFLVKQSQFIDSDSEFSYSIVDHIHTPKHVLVLPIPEGSELILATDGYPVLKNTLADSEAALKTVLLEDPLCYHLHTSTKGIMKGHLSFDDRTYLRLRT